MNQQTYNPRRLLALVLIAALATVASGYVSGQLSNRWGKSDDAARGSLLIESIPTEVGVWRFQGRQELSDDSLDQLECYAYENGGYLNTETGEVIQLSLIVGPFGPMSVHSPDICYPAAGYQPTGERHRTQISTGRETADLWVTSFQPRGLGTLPLSVYYSWNAHGVWLAPDNARFSLGGAPVVFKLQVASRADASGEASNSKDSCERFLEEFLPIWRDKYHEVMETSQI